MVVGYLTILSRTDVNFKKKLWNLQAPENVIKNNLTKTMV
jgi:hypothetical protein